MERNHLKSTLGTIVVLSFVILATLGLTGLGLARVFATDNTVTEQDQEVVASSDDSSQSKDNLLGLIAQIDMPELFGNSSDTFQVDGYTFYSVKVPEALEQLYGEPTFTVYPMEWADVVTEVKQTLQDSFGENYFISYTQMRPEVIGCLDEQFAVLIETVYLFTGTEREIRLDDYTQYLLTHLTNLSEEMTSDIYTVYKHLLITRGLEGSLSRSGYAEGLYYYAQTDPDWADYPFPNENSDTEYDDTMQDRSCGVMSFNMVAATYLHHEIAPTVLADYAVENGYRVEAHGVEDTFFHVAAEYYGIPDPAIYYAEDGIDWDYIISKITEDNAMVIVHEYTGPFTSRQHYMVLEGYEVIDGTGYFLVADPYVLRSRYSGWDQLLDPNRGNDGLIYATPEIIAETCSAATVFDADKTAWDMTAQAAASENLLVVEPVEDTVE